MIRRVIGASKKPPKSFMKITKQFEKRYEGRDFLMSSLTTSL